MWIQKKISKEDVLEVFVKEMYTHGINKDLFTLSINQINERIKNKTRKDISLDELRSLLNECLADEWLRNQYFEDTYSLTPTGKGVITSRRSKKELLANRSFLKKASDFFDDHKGLFIPLSAFSGVVALISIVKMIKK